MKIRYVWINSNRTRVDYEYEVKVKDQDIAGYIKSINYQLKKVSLDTITKVVQTLTDWDNIDIDKLEEQDEFIDYMRDKYEGEAYNEYMCE